MALQHRSSASINFSSENSEAASVFLSRLPSLTTLHLEGHDDDDDGGGSRVRAAALVEQLGASCHDDASVSTLHLSGSCDGSLTVSPSLCVALSRGFPHLQSLHLGLGIHFALSEGRSLLSLRDVSLIQLTSTVDDGDGEGALGSDTLRSIGHLRTLQFVELYARDSQLGSALSSWTGLTGLVECSLLLPDVAEEAVPEDPTVSGAWCHAVWRSFSITSVAPLFALTSLTSLHAPVSTLPRTSPPMPYEAAKIVTAAAAAAAASAALARLANLSNLVSLRLGDWFFVDAAGLSALSALSRLTELQVGRLLGPLPACYSDPFGSAAPAAETATSTSTAETGSGCLPRLQLLVLWGALKPSELLAALQPLLPLPALTRITTAGAAAFDATPTVLHLWACGADERDAEQQAAALKQAAAYLFAAPNYAGLHTLQVHWGLPDASRCCSMSVEELVHGLGPTAATVQSMTWHGEPHVAAAAAPDMSVFRSLAHLTLLGPRERGDFASGGPFYVPPQNYVNYVTYGAVSCGDDNHGDDSGEGWVTDAWVARLTEGERCPSALQSLKLGMEGDGASVDAWERLASAGLPGKPGRVLTVLFDGPAQDTPQWRRVRAGSGGGGTRFQSNASMHDF